MKRKRSNQQAISQPLESRRLLTSTITFAPHVDFAVGTTPDAIVAADFNSDGNEDLAVADSTTDKVYVFFGNGAGSFSAGPVLSLSSPPSAMITGDFNGDGKPDIAVACSAGAGQSTTSVDVFLNTGEGTFGLGQISTVETGAVPGEPVALAAADFNDDGHLDLAVTDYTAESISILLGNGAGAFAAPVNYQSDAHPTAITEADFNDDGHPDLAIISTLTDSSTGTTITSNDLSLLYGGGGSDFSAGPNIPLSISGIPSSLVAANLTGATSPGVIVGSSGGTATVFTNSGGSLSQSNQTTLPAGSTALAVGDFDLDGTTDFVSSDGGSSTSTSTDSVTVVQGLGGGNIGNTTSFSVGTQPADVVVADFNNDGKPDIATANEGGTVSVLLSTTAIPAVSTKTALAVSATSTPAGSPVTVTATITATSVSPLTNEEVPTGTVNFFDGSILISTVTLAATQTQAVFSTEDLAIGKHTLRAVYSGDDGYAKSTSAAIVETITPTATEGPDLIGTFVSSTLPAEIAPGETGNVSIRITNQGNFLATGSISNDLYLSLDTQVDSDDTLVTVHGSLARARVHLKPGQSAVLTGSITIPQSTPLASYYLLVAVNATGSLAESVSTNNLAASPSTFTVADVFGTVDGRKGIALTVADNNGTPATFRLTGPGNGTVNIGDDGVDLILDQTTASSAVSVTTKGPAAFQLHNLTADTAVRSITMPGVSVSDSASLLGGAGTVSLNTLGSADAAGSLTISGGTVSSIAIASVPAASLISTGGIRSLSVGDWGDGQITAPWIGVLRSRQDFMPTLQLSGIGAPGGVALNSATIGASIVSATWTVAGTINRLSAAAFTTGWTLNESGTLNSILSAGAFSVTINALKIGSIQARGGATGAVITSAGAIRSINIAGPVDSTTKFLAAAFPKKAILGGVAVNPLTDPNFTVT